MRPSENYIVRALAAEKQIRAFAIRDDDIVKTMKQIHDLSPTATIALGKLSTAGLLMGDLLKSKEDLLTVQIISEKGLRHLLVTADFEGHVKGYASIPNYNSPDPYDTSSSLGKGNITVIRDYHLKEPYSSTIPLRAGDISSDLTYYFLQSEQTFTNVGLAVNLDDKNSISSSYGYLIQLMPFTKEEVIQKLTKNLSSLPSLNELVKTIKTPEELLSILLDGFDFQFTEKKEVSFYCGCEKRKNKIISTIGKEELDSLIKEGKTVETTCAFCKKKYSFSIDDLKQIRASMS